MEDYYGILGTSVTSTKEDLRKCYIKKMLQYHPDKQQQGEQHGTSVEFHKIEQAWKILGDDIQRKQYDTLLKEQCLHQDVSVSEKIFIEDMTWNSDTHEYKWPCRCGDIYILGEDAVEDRVILSCETCSLSVLVHTCTPVKVCETNSLQDIQR
ncbi:dnaJ homolog subfamily C member 24-like isoform X2 [Tachypleus tridentatus]|uniref:dnaJ homolog subfamily C member 24-like isoform X2 n=1 Tax=Tachypleus tridentatus TaxID=6853 RepID=UPI003FD33063